MLSVLDNHEKLVLDVVHEYLNKNRTFNMSKVLPFIISRFKLASININIDGIEKILKSLVKKKILVEGSKLTKDEILINRKRNEIYNLIIEKPGIYFSQITSNLNYSNHLVFWHTEFLIRFNFILKESFDNHEIFFDSHIDFEAVKINYITSREKSKKIIDFLKQNNVGTSKTWLSSVLDMHPQTVAKYLDLLEEIEWINKEKISNKTLYFLNSDK